MTEITEIVLTKNHNNPSGDFLALRAFVSLSWICACEQAPAQTMASSHIASQRKTSTEAKNTVTLRYTKKLHGERLKIEN